MTTARHLDYCPFCGEENDLTLVINDDTQFGGYVGYITCGHCAAQGGTHAGVESVYELTETLIQDWNQAGRATVWDRIVRTCWTQPISDLESFCYERRNKD
jgi:hypothetical protein